MGSGTRKQGSPDFLFLGTIRHAGQRGEYELKGCNQWKDGLVMKKVLAVSVLLIIGFVLGVSWKEMAVHAAGGGIPAGNGDVNGDGSIDISDAVYLLSSLFLGGKEPVQIECPPPGGKGLPATGQTRCYDSVGNVIDCASTDFPRQDGAYQAGCPSEERFLDNGDGTVTDKCTGLIWQKETADIDEDGAIGDGDLLNWQDALKYCESLDLADHRNWRLPNMRELQSIIDYGRINPAIDPIFGTALDWYWSSTSYVDSSVYAWGVRFNSGHVGDSGHDGKVLRYYVRAVRSGL
jgi:hypothetical protein